MKKLKQMSGPYSIGFELSSTAHGFVATDPNGNVLYHGKQPVMGTRVFKEGQHAAEARMPRTSRRGIQRRRGREHEMERVFAPVISSIDPDFFIRRRMSYKLGKIRFESDPIGFSYSRLFHSFPTLAHLDVALMEADSAMDPRLIFEAVANHVVRRGHFLLENQNVSSTNSDIDTQVANYAEVLVSYFEDTLDERIELSLEALDINGNVTARELQKQFASAMCVSGDDIQKKTEKAQIKAIADLVAGYKADLTVLVPDAEKLPKVSISDGDALEEFLADSCPDSLVPVLMAAQALYTSWKLQGMLSYAPGKSLSHNQVAQHDVYGKQLRMLKDLALKYVAKQDANGNVDEDGFILDEKQAAVDGLQSGYDAALAAYELAKSDRIAAEQKLSDEIARQKAEEAAKQQAAYTPKHLAGTDTAQPGSLAQTGDRAGLIGETFVIGGTVLVAAGVFLDQKKRREQM